MSAANGIEVVLWLHSVLYEIITGTVVDGRPNTEDTFPLCTPFKQPDLITECSDACKFDVNVARYLNDECAFLQCGYHGTQISGGSIYHAIQKVDIIDEKMNWDPVCRVHKTDDSARPHRYSVRRKKLHVRILSVLEL